MQRLQAALVVDAEEGNVPRERGRGNQATARVRAQLPAAAVCEALQRDEAAGGVVEGEQREAAGS